MFSTATNLLPTVFGNLRTPPASSKTPEDGEQQKPGDTDHWIVSETRRQELLQQARNHRLSWIMDEKPSSPTITEALPPHGCSSKKNLDIELNDDDDDLHRISQEVISFLQHCSRQVPEQDPPMPSFDKDVSPFDLSSRYSDHERFQNAVADFRSNCQAHPGATSDFIARCQAFVTEYHHHLTGEASPAPPPPLTGSVVHTFIEEQLLTRSTAIAVVFSPDVTHELQHEILETMLMKKLGGLRLMKNDSVGSDRERDFQARCDNLRSLISFKHLDLPEPRESLDTWIALAQALGHELHVVDSPREKLQVISSVSQELSRVWASQQGHFPTADELLPSLIWLILNSKMTHVYATIAYIQEYRHPSRLASESLYYFTHFVSAVTFLEGLEDASMLSKMDREEFQHAIGRQKEELSQNSCLSSLPYPSTFGDEDNERMLKSPSVPTVLETRQRRLDMERQHSQTCMIDKMKSCNLEPVVPHRWPKSPSLDDRGFCDEQSSMIFPSTFKGIQAHELQMKDIPLLVREYQQLVSKCRMLHASMIEKAAAPVLNNPGSGILHTLRKRMHSK